MRMKRIPSLITLTRLATALGASTITTLATPYATCLSNNPVGTVSFRLNAPANSVRVIYNSGASSTNLGALPQGLTVTNLGIAGAFSVGVTDNSGRGWLQGVTNQISADTNKVMQFANQRGVAVNMNPASPFFGRIYVSLDRAGTNNFPATSPTTSRYLGKGIYVINPDQTDALGQQNADGTNTTARTGGLTFGATEGPHRLTVGPDGNLYISDWSDTFGSLYVTDPDVATNALATDVFGGPTGSAFPVGATKSHGSINASFVTGSLATSDLTVYAIDEDLQPDKVTTTATVRNSIWRWDIGPGPLPATSVTPVLFASVGPGTPTFNGIGGSSQLSDFTIGPGGIIYHTQRRANNASTDGIVVRSADGTTRLWDSLAATRTLLGNSSASDLFSESQAVDVSPAGPQARFMAVMKQNTNSVTFFALDPATGIPDITNRILLAVSPTTGIGRDISFDAAGNLYSVSSGQGLLRIYSPGGTTVATTSSDGTFTITNLLPGVAITATQPNASDDGTTGTVNVSRTGDTSSALTVFYSVGGTASNGVDYATIPASVVIPAAASSVDVTVSPIPDLIAEPTESVILTVVDNTNYFVLGRAATVLIVDTNAPALSVASISPSMYERITNDYATVTIARNLGNTNVAVTLSDPGAFTFGGTAVMDVDYVVNSNLFPVIMNVGDRSMTINLVSPLDNSLLDGNRTLVIGMVSGVDYTAATNTATTTIIDDEVPSETVLWSDNFNNADSATNYLVKFGSQNNTLQDYSATFAYDYSASGVPPAPHDGGTNTQGLWLNVNKDGTAAAAGVNFYPTNASFGTNFALRFDMFLFNGTASTTEYAIFGINHDATKTNWFRANANGYTNSAYDGLWCEVESDASGTDDYELLTGPKTTNVVSGVGYVQPTIRSRANATTFKQVFKSPPFSAGGVGGGSPANPISLVTPTWAEVEIAQVGKLVSLRINNSLILSYNNTANAAATNGYVMLGYLDAFDSIGNSLGVIYDNARVVRLFPPTILTQPTSATTPIGGTTNFTVVASGTTTGFTNYQWRLNNVAIAGATNATITFGSVQLTNYGTYTVVVTDGAYPVTSTAVTLFPPGPAIITPPGSQAAAVGGTAAFSVVATTTTGTTNYQWMLNATNVAGANYSGATNANLGINPVQATSFGPYRVRVNDGFTSVTSIVVNLTVAVQPTITNSLSGSTLNLIFPTEIGPRYVLEWKGALTNGAWNQLVTNTGTGSPITVPDSTLTDAQRFYRVRMQ